MNYSGELWYREGLPSDVFRRLVVRKENETPLDRFSGDYEELMTYANFRDLADIIVGNQVLKDRLTILEPRDGAGLLDRLHELEEIRRSISSSRSASEEDTKKLNEYFEEFRTALKRGKQPTREPSSKRPARKPAAGEIAPEDETLDSIFDEIEEEEKPAPASTNQRPGRLVVKVSAGGLRNAGGKSDARPKRKAPPAPLETIASEVDSMETPVTDVSVRPDPTEEEPRGPVEDAEGVERALRDEDDAAILRALHVEVTEIADGMLRRDPKHGHVVWEHVRRRGWFDAHREEFDLEPLEVFYRLSDEFLDAFSSGAKSSELKVILAEAGFSKMLLAMREMFLKSRGRA